MNVLFLSLYTFKIGTLMIIKICGCRFLYVNCFLCYICDTYFPVCCLPFKFFAWCLSMHFSFVIPLVDFILRKYFFSSQEAVLYRMILKARECCDLDCPIPQHYEHMAQNGAGHLTPLHSQPQEMKCSQRRCIIFHVC